MHVVAFTLTLMECPRPPVRSGTTCVEGGQPRGAREDLNEAVMEACEELFTSQMELGDAQSPDLGRPPTPRQPSP